MQTVIDWETRSTVDIGKCGAFVYAAHPDTEIMSLSIAVNEDKPLLWVPRKFRELINPTNLLYKMVTSERAHDLILKSDKVIAHNASFEYVIWRKIAHERLGWPALPLELLHDTMAQAAYHALPLALAQLAQALNLTSKKNMRGHAVMLKLCKPRKPLKAEREANPNWASTIHWHEDPADLESLFNYCGQDAVVERRVYHSLAPLPDKEREIWLLDQKINMRGVSIDVENVKAIVKLTSAREVEQLARFQELTDGQVSGPRSYVALRKWVNEKTSLQLASVDKTAVEALLAQKNGLPPFVREVLQIKSELSKSSVAKFRGMLSRTNTDGRLRGMFQYGGASTLRWAARGVQLHNLPRDSYSPEVWEHVARLFRENDREGMYLLYDDPFFVASRCVRGSLCTKAGCRKICADFSSIEARGNAFLAGEMKSLEAFKSGKDTYKVAAQSIFNVAYEDVDKDQRQVGKVSELALGYGGGIGAYASLAKGYGIDLETLPPHIMPYARGEEIDGPYGARSLAKAYLTQNPESMSLEAAIACDVIKRKWRESHPNIVRFWKGLEQAAYLAVENPGKVYSYNGIKYCVHNNFLKCLMPSGRLMHYYLPKIKPVATSWDDAKLTITYMGMKVVDGATTRQWTRLATYGGKLCENVVQAYCRDLLAEAMLRLEAAGYPQVLHVHDEAAAEMPDGRGSLAEFEKIMAIVPPWAKGMPIDAKGWEGRRYRK